MDMDKIKVPKNFGKLFIQKIHHIHKSVQKIRAFFFRKISICENWFFRQSGAKKAIFTYFLPWPLMKAPNTSHLRYFHSLPTRWFQGWSQSLEDWIWLALTEDLFDFFFAKRVPCAFHYDLFGDVLWKVWNRKKRRM